MHKKITMFLVMVTILVGFQVQVLAKFSDWIKERKYLCMTAAYALVAADLQTVERHPRGYNIGCVLLEGKVPGSRLVGKGLNSIVALSDGTRHAEVVCIESYIQEFVERNVKKPEMKDMVLFTTLEPCVQCSGMIIMQYVSEVIYGIEDPGYGKTIDKLKKNGYPTNIAAGLAQDNFSIALNEKFKQWKRRPENRPKHTYEFLEEPDVLRVFQDAATFFRTHIPEYPENVDFLNKARMFVPPHPQPPQPPHLPVPAGNH